MPREATLDDILTKVRGFMESQTILTAHEMGVFNKIGVGSVPARDLARELDLSERGLTILLDALTSTGILEKEENCYRNTGTGLKHLVESGEDFRGATLDHAIRMREMWLRLGDAVRSGTSPRKPEESLVDNRERNRTFILAMKDIGAPSARVIADNLALSPYRKMLDLGGGPGSYSMEIIKRFPDIRATVVDLPLTLDVAEEVISAAGMEDRIDLRAADFFGDPDCDIGEGYDLVLISNVLHIEGPQKNRDLLKKVYGSMEKGMIIIHEAIINDDRISPPDRAIFAVNMLVHTERGNCYTFDEMKGWLEEAGFRDVEFVDCFEMPSLMVAYKR